MPAPLSKLQKRTLILEHLRPAFNIVRAKAEALGVPMLDTAAAFDAWRRFQIGEACGKAGLRCCSQDDYLPIIARCWHLRGRDDIAFNILARDPAANERRQVMHKLRGELARGGLDIGYAQVICRRQFNCDMEDASVKNLWCLFFTVRSRVNSKLKKQPAITNQP